MCLEKLPMPVTHAEPTTTFVTLTKIKTAIAVMTITRAMHPMIISAIATADILSLFFFIDHFLFVPFV